MLEGKLSIEAQDLAGKAARKCTDEPSEGTESVEICQFR